MLNSAVTRSTGAHTSFDSRAARSRSCKHPRPRVRRGHGAAPLARRRPRRAGHLRPAGRARPRPRQAADRDRPRRRRGHRRPARHPGGDRDAPGRRQRRRRGGGRGRRARCDGALLVRHRRRWLHDDPDARRQGHHDRLAREGARRDAPGLVPRERRRARIRPGSLERAVRRRARHRRRLGARAAPLRNAVAGEALRAGHHGGPRRLHRRRDLRLQTEPAAPYFDDVPSTAELYLDEDGIAARRRRHDPQPRSRPHLPDDRPGGRRAPSTGESSPRRSSTPSRPRRSRRTPTTCGGPA